MLNIQKTLRVKFRPLKTEAKEQKAAANEANPDAENPEGKKA